MSSEHEREQGNEREEDEVDAGLAGGGGPSETLPEHPGPGDEDRHLADTDHRER